MYISRVASASLDELFEIVTLIQTKKIEPIPVVLFGKDYWEPLLRFFEKDLLKKHKTISKEDLEIFHLVDSVDEHISILRKR